MRKLEVNFQDIFFRDGKSPIDDVTWSRWFGVWLESLDCRIPAAESYELTLRLTDDEEIKALNHQYRQKNQATDVLAFASLEVDIPETLQEYLEDEPLYLGDIIISVNTATKQAQEIGHSLETELANLAAHGFLHLLGWDHPDDQTLSEMLSQQETLLRCVGLINLDYT